MTKEMYYEMCEMLGNEPNPDETPVSLDDMPVEVQEAINIYSRIRDDWDTMNGNYLGKNYNGILDILTILGVEPAEMKTVFELIGTIDQHRSKAIKDNKPADKNTKPG